MKICHCVKMTDEEKKALETTLNMLRDLRNDGMLSGNFEDEYGMDIGDLISWLADVIEFFEKW